MHEEIYGDQLENIDEVCKEAISNSSSEMDFDGMSTTSDSTLIATSCAMDSDYAKSTMSPTCSSFSMIELTHVVYKL